MGESPGSSQSTDVGLPMKSISLISLTIHTTVSILLLHHTQIMPPIGGLRYLPSTAVFLSELLKLSLALTFSLYEISRAAPPSLPVTSLFSTLSRLVFTGDSWKVAVPAVLYTVANELVFVGIGNLEAPVFGALSLGKIVVTAVMSYGLLGKSLGGKRWISLAVLIIGLGFVVTGSTGGDGESLAEESVRAFVPRSLDFLGLSSEVRKTAKRVTKRSATYEGIAEDEMLSAPHFNSSVGVISVIGMAICSGTAGVWFEKILKENVGSTKTSLWVRNVQLAVYSLFPALFIGVVFLDGETVAKGGFFQGWNGWVWAVVITQALGGFVVATSIYYADNVVKDFARAVSVVGAAIGGMWLFGFEASGNFLLGIALVLGSTYIYTTSPPSSSHLHEAHSHSRRPLIKLNGFDKMLPSAEDLQKPQDFSIKLPTTPLISEELGRTTSRPGSPNEGGKRHHARASSGRGYFGKQA